MMRHALLAPWQVHCMCDKWPSSMVCQLLGEQGEESRKKLRNGNSTWRKMWEKGDTFSKVSFWVSMLNLVGVLFSSPIWGRWTHFHKFISFSWVGSTRWFKPCLFFGVVWFVTFSGIKLSHLQFGESFQKVTNGRSWLYQLMVNN